TYTAPVKTMTGQDLANISKVDIYRDEEFIGSQTPGVGEKMSYTDSEVTRGEHTYRLVAVNENGEGDSATVTAFAGFDWPLEPTNVHARRGGNNGEIIVSWTPPTKDQNGLTFPEGAVTYEVYRIVDKSGRLIAENYKDTEITDQAVVPDGRNSIVQYQIISKYQGKGGNFECTGIITVGAPYELPFAESVPQGKATHNWRTWQDLNSPSRWYGATDANFDGCDSQDGDNGYFLFDGGSQPNHSACIISSAIKIGAEDSPVLSFYLFKVANATQNILHIWIRDCSDPEGEFSILKDVSMGDGYTLNWNRHEISLADYAGKEIQLVFEGTVVNYSYAMIDNIRVENPSAVELKSEILTGPGKAFAGSPIELTSYFVNNGIEESGDFRIALYRDNNIVDEVEVKSIAPGARSSVSFEQKTPVIYTGEVKFKTEIISDKDADAANNISNELSVYLEEPTFPVPTALVGASKNEDVYLSWEAPSNEGDVDVNPTLTDDFEAYPSFSNTNAGVWKFYDFDGKGTGGIQGIEFPGQNIDEPATWMVFDKLAIPGFNPNSFEMVSGSKCLAVLYNYHGEPNDDWVVSPRLSGREQNISFYALALTENKDRLEIMVSSTDNNPESFTKLYDITDFVFRWRKYTAPLPEGTTYFALRYCSADGTAVFVDDISYEAYIGALDNDISGYNVYRNGEIINSEPVAECNYIDEAPGEGMYMYHVTALYGENESSPCDYVFVAHKPSGIFDAESVATRIHVDGNTLIVTTDDDTAVEIYTLSGLKAAEHRGSFSVTLSSGVYLVSIHGKVIKINL
ncbi:MAG: choice-of-anchor J domain-containing protein, partial [Muribaculaceae bacterium]|nr:choice-of-anchor J domain-containing protein [Muribaculaceae bacterium]